MLKYTFRLKMKVLKKKINNKAEKSKPSKVR